MSRTLTNRFYWRALRLIGLKQKTWDLQFAQNIWDRGPRSPHTLRKVRELCRGRSILEFGCGTGTLPHALPPESFSEYLGVDVSSVAIRTAVQKWARAGSPHCRFEAGDMAKWNGFTAPVSLILFEECLYYLSSREAEDLLARCCANLSADGAILVIASSPVKHRQTLAICRRACVVLLEELIEGRAYLTLGPIPESSSRLARRLSAASSGEMSN